MIAAETDTRRKAQGPSLADLMLNRGATLPRVAPRNIEQAVTKTETVEQDVPVTDITEPAINAPCTQGACLHADPASPCKCYHCLGKGHGHATRLIQDAARATMQARIDKAGGVFGTLASVDLDSSIVIVSGPFNPNPIVIDGECW